MEINHPLNHTAAHILAAALKKMYPNIKLAIGPSIDDGFYYDFWTDTPISINDLPKIEKQMQKIISSAQELKHGTWTKKEALNFYKDNKYKTEIIDELPDGEEISYYENGDFKDLCKGPHAKNTKDVKAFKLLSVAGSYWRGDAKNDQLTRIYGVAFDNKNDLDEFLKILEERKERDHRKIGKDLQLFTFSPLAGPGLPIWLPNGEKIKNQIEHYVENLQFEYDFLPVSTPVLGSSELYKTSGHWDHYRENMFPPMKIDNEELVLRPMTCPHHILVYKSEPYSYRQLPIRLCERSNLHRYEASGGLTGLERVREMVLEDTHIFCRMDQIKDEVHRCYEMIKQAHHDLGSEIYRVDFSLNDPNDHEKYHGNKEMWDLSQKLIREALDENHIPYTEMIGEAAFYGPKIDFQVKTALGRIITVSTIQLDFLLPERFDLHYKNEQGLLERPVMIHLGLIGTYERYLAILLEQTKGVLPLWLAPTQVAIIPVNPEVHGKFSEALRDKLKKKHIRVNLDARNERIAKKIREAQISKIPYQIVIGDKEMQDANLVSYRKYGSEEVHTISFDEFVKMLEKEIEAKERPSLKS